MMEELQAYEYKEMEKYCSQIAWIKKMYCKIDKFDSVFRSFQYFDFYFTLINYTCILQTQTKNFTILLRILYKSSLEIYGQSRIQLYAISRLRRDGPLIGFQS